MPKEVRPIDANALIYEMMDMHGHGMIPVLTVSGVAKSPTLDYAPIIRAHWQLNKDGSGTCSNCHRTQGEVWDMDTWQNFCGHCGADMREVEYETD